MPPVGLDVPFDNAGPWTPPEAQNAKLEGVTVEARSVLGGILAELKGKAKGKEEIAAGGELFTLPPGLRPVVGTPVVACVVMETEAGVPTVNNLKIATNGKVTIGAALPAKSTINLDAVTFNLT